MKTEEIENPVVSQEDAVTKTEKIRYMVRLALSFIGILIIVYVCVEILPDVISLLKSGDSQALEEYIGSMGARGVVMLVLLQVIQTITIFFPGVPIYMCSGIVYGKLWGTLICYITYVTINVLVFIFVRRAKEAADALINKKDDSGMGELMLKAKHPEYLVMALCVVPIIPNGMVPYIAAPSQISLKKFATSVAIGCIPGIFLFVCCGDLLMSKYFWVIVIAFIVVIALTIVAFIFKAKLKAFALKVMDKFFSGKSGDEE